MTDKYANYANFTTFIFGETRNKNENLKSVIILR